MMTTHAAATAAAATVAGINGGAFRAFSTFVMPALADVDVTTGVEAMQAINRSAPRPFAASLFGGIALGALATVTGVRRGRRAAAWAAAGTALDVAALAVTAISNIPRNNDLATWNSDATDPARWTTWVRGWTTPNTVRTLFSLGALAAFALSAAAGRAGATRTEGAQR